jgi:hypothetical protein
VESYKETYEEGIKITDLKEGNLIYIRKIINDYLDTYECEFIRFHRGIVTAKLKRISYNGNEWQDREEIITARPNKCFLWGKDATSQSPFCHWFKNKNEGE